MAAQTSQPLYLITDGYKLRLSGKLISSVAAALRGAEGAIGFVQLREQLVHPATDQELLELGKALLPICREANAKLIISRRADLAKAIGASGVQIGSDAPDPAAIRAVLGEQAIVGYSAHTVSEALEVAPSVSYLLVAPVFPPRSKELTGEVFGVENLRTVAHATNTSIFALGGITAENAPECRKAGASGIASISTLILEDDPEQSARNLHVAWIEAPAI